ncbi:MAG: ScpA family protein [Candidatus Gastranaerophilales bacterium]|nr:ScpA family protein [Candidatus Gastranaerophilales bacterium]
MIDNVFESAISIQKSNAKDGIEILVNMAKRNELDPWNVNIVEVTDKYLHHLVELKQNNLRLTGRTLLFAAILLRLKSDILEGIDPLMLEEEAIAEFEEDYDDPDFEMEQLAGRANIISIDEALERRTSVKLNRKRVVTLKDLIKQLEFYEELERKRSLRNAHERAKRRVRSYANLTADDIINLAHDEYIEDSVKKLFGILERLFESNEKVELSELQVLGMDKISTYIALLFLSADGRVDLVQDEFYSDLYVIADDLKGEHEPKVQS